MLIARLDDLGTVQVLLLLREVVDEISDSVELCEQRLETSLFKNMEMLVTRVWLRDGNLALRA